MTSRLFRYLGPAELASQASATIERLQPVSPDEVRVWLNARARRSYFTFVVDEAGRLWLSDRGTEHVACARGGAVLAAGEIELALRGDVPCVEYVSNQSTGYCPEPSCWSAV